MRRFTVPLVALTLAVSACGELASSAPAPPALTPAPDAYSDAPAEVELAGARWRIGARAWRNVQPHAGGGGVPRCANLCAKVVVELVSGEADGEVTVAGVWALRHDGMAPFAEFDTERVDDGLEVTAERGPRTDAGSRVIVVVQLQSDGRSALVRAPEIEVGPQS